MKNRLFISALLVGCSFTSGIVAAQEVGNVISSTPVLKRVTEQRSVCGNDASGQQICTKQMVTEDRTIGYKVVYEYAGRQLTAQLPFPPGATIPIEVNVSASANSGAPNRTVYSAAPEVVETVYRDRVYTESPYYSQPYYSQPYYSSYYSPLYPLIGLGLGYAAGYYGYGYGYGYRGGYGYGYRGGHHVAHYGGGGRGYGHSGGHGGRGHGGGNGGGRGR